MRYFLLKEDGFIDEHGLFFELLDELFDGALTTGASVYVQELVDICAKREVDAALVLIPQQIEFVIVGALIATMQ